MNAQRAVQIVMMLAVPVLAVYVIGPAVRAHGGQTAILWGGLGFVVFGVILIALSRLLPVGRPRTPS